MVNKLQVARVGTLVRVYVAVVAVTLVVLVVLTVVGSAAATDEARGHAVVVAVFAVLLPLRWRSAARGAAGAWRAVGIIAAVLVVVNLVEAVLPGVFPVWMRVEMVGIAVLMAGVVGLVAQRRG